jgi:hypothetical protein
MHTYTYKHYSPQSLLYCCCLIAAFNGSCSLSSGFQNCSWPQLLACRRISSQQSNCSSSLICSLIHQPTHFTNQLMLFLLIKTQHGQRRKPRVPLLLYPLAVETCFCLDPLLSSCCYIINYFANIASEWASTPQCSLLRAIVLNAQQALGLAFLHLDSFVAVLLFNCSHWSLRKASRPRGVRAASGLPPSSWGRCRRTYTYGS